MNPFLQVGMALRSRPLRAAVAGPLSTAMTFLPLALFSSSTTHPPGETEALFALALGLLSVWLFSLHLLRRLRLLEDATRDQVTRSTLDNLGQLLMTKMDEKFDEMEAAQAKREAERLAYLLKNAELLGGVSSANQLLTGQLATLAAKLDRQIELTRLQSAPVSAPLP